MRKLKNARKQDYGKPPRDRKSNGGENNTLHMAAPVHTIQ